MQNAVMIKGKRHNVLHILQSSLGKNVLLDTHRLLLICIFMQELPGRLWEGKECLLEALAAICKAAPAKLDAHKGSHTI